jgi:ubiquitin C-terminal hydrolase
VSLLGSLAAALLLQDCLSAFVEQEVLTGSEAVKCGSCKRTCDATKRLQIFQCPQLLVLTLKRFNSGSSSRGGGAGGWAGSGGGGWFGFSPYSKNQTPVKVDAQHALDLSPYCNQQALKAAVDGAGTGRGCSKPHYQLLAVSEHSGCLGGGHYTAQGRNVADGRWYDFNDASVTPDSHPSGSSSSAYVLFFRLIGDCV